MGRVAVITGGSSGIGQAIACRLASDGARVAIADVVPAEETLDRIRRDGGEAISAQCDISDGAQVTEFVRTVTHHLASPLILVHCAAVQLMCSFDALTFDQWRRTQSVNQDSMFHLLKAVLPAMKVERWGRIIVIASSTFYVGTAALSHYVASKGALIGLVRGLAAEIGPDGITINAVAPGLTRTSNAVANVPDSYFQQVKGLQAVPRSGTPEDQAGIVSFMASGDAAFITGQTILADGGQGRN
jgi:NAD(P)-dependent dehydrogenase (short-subunit alcohol dehydrogenase family)